MKDITIIIPTTAIPSQPSTEIIERVIASIRAWFPTEPILLCFDGMARHIRKIDGREENYNEYIRRCRQLCVDKWVNVKAIVFSRWEHQSGIVRKMLSIISSKYILFHEHDCAFRLDRSEPRWDTIFKALDSGQTNLVRLPHWEEGVWPEHDHLTTGSFDLDEAKFICTQQFSGWPFITTAVFMHRMITLMPVGYPLFLEVYLYEYCMREPEWFKISIYCPGFPNQRFTHLNGRQGDPPCPNVLGS